MSTTTNLPTLKINYLTQAQYDSALSNNEINENELYLTPDAIQTSGDWTYIRLGDVFIGSYRTTLNLSITNQVGQVWTCYNQTINYPITLSAVYYADVTVATGSYNVWTSIMSSSTQGVAFRAMSTASRSAADYTIKCFVFGKV